MSNRNDPNHSLEESHEQHRDFNDTANDLWSLYGKKAESHHQARIKTLKDDMGGILIFVCAFFSPSTRADVVLQAGLFSGVLTAFVVPQIQTLQVNPADQSVYYQNQSVQMLDRISQQLASVGSQIPTNFTPPSPYPTFHPSASDRRVNIFWLISLVCSLSAALLATLVQQWYRAYMNVFQQSRSPLKAARVQLFLFESVEGLPIMAEAVPGLIHVSVILFLWGLGDIILYIDTTVFVATVIPIAVCVCFYLHYVVAPIRNPQSPYWTPFSRVIWRLIQNLHRIPYFDGKGLKLASLELCQEHYAMVENEGRMDRDVRGVRWLVDNINGTDETEEFVLAIPGSFDREWGISVWKGVVSDVQSTSPGLQVQTHPPLGKGPAVSNLSRCVRYFFEAYSNEGDSMDSEERRRRMRGCVETAASLVCCTEVELGLFGEVGEVLKQLSALGDKEGTNDPSTININPSFTVRWTCLSLVAIWKMINSNRLQELAKFALDGITYSRLDDVGSTDAQRIDNYLKKAWAPVVDLLLAFEPWSQDMTKIEIKGILNSCEASILALERVAVEAVGVEDIDWRISFLQDAMDGATQKLMRHLPGVSFSELKPAARIVISEAFDFSFFEATPVPSRLIFLGQQIQSLCTLGQRLRDIIEDRNTEMHEETLKSLKSLREIPVAVRGLNHLMKRQLWRLLDLRDGGGLGFTIELFFLAVRQLSSTTSLSELKEIFYTGTFKVITSNWEKSKDSAGTQRVLLDLLCDLIIRRRGVFSDFSYPPYIVDMLLDLVGKMADGHGGLRPHINDIIQELEDKNLWNRMDTRLRDRALRTIIPSSDTTSS